MVLGRLLWAPAATERVGTAQEARSDGGGDGTFGGQRSRACPGFERTLSRGL